MKRRNPILRGVRRGKNAIDGTSVLRPGGMERGEARLRREADEVGKRALKRSPIPTLGPVREPSEPLS